MRSKWALDRVEAKPSSVVLQPGLLLRGAVNQDILTASPGVVKPTEPEKPQAQPQPLCQQRLRRFLVKRESQLVVGSSRDICFLVPHSPSGLASSSPDRSKDH